MLTTESAARKDRTSGNSNTRLEHRHFAWMAATTAKQRGKAMKIVKAYTRYYRDNRQLTAYVEWQDGSRTEGPAYLYHGVRVPRGVHMGQLFDAAIRDGLSIAHETW